MSRHRYAVIMAGGSGERFWPLSRKHRPKQLLRLTHPEQTLLEEAVDRVEPVVGREHIVIATTPHLQAPVCSAGLVDDANVVAEPDKRNTLGCLVWAAAVLAARHGESEQVSMAVLTADHKIASPAAFCRTVERALDIAEQSGALVTIGIVPDRPETGYGYIECGGGISVASFREKPNVEAAQEYVNRGNFLWNSGMFFWTLESFYRELEGADSAVAATARRIAGAVRAGDLDVAKELFRELPNQSIDYALMERAKNVAVVPAEFPWDDVGAWDALERSMPTDSNGNVLQGDMLAIDVRGSILYNENPQQTLTVIGQDDLIVIVTADAVMICSKAEAQRVKEIVAALPERLL